MDVYFISESENDPGKRFGYHKPVPTVENPFCFGRGNGGYNGHSGNLRNKKQSGLDNSQRPSGTVDDMTDFITFMNQCFNFP